MVLNNKIKKLRQDRGFTIVELLIVIVVIAILAAIVIVSYSGITARANQQKALTNATAARDVAEAYNADNGKYPTLTTDFAAGTSTKLPAGITVSIGQAGANGTTFDGTNPLTSANALTNVAYSCFITCTNSTGGRIAYWDPVTNARSTNVIYVGAAGASNGAYVAPAS